MAKTTVYKEHSHMSPGVVRVSGSFTTAGASAPTGVLGPVTIGAPAAQGVYTLTGRGTFSAIIGFGTTLLDATADANDTVRFGAITPTSNPWTATIITARAAGTDSHLTGPVVGWWIDFRDTVNTV
jgi:hypothetical protein